MGCCQTGPAPGEQTVHRPARCRGHSPLSNCRLAFQSEKGVLYRTFQSVRGIAGVATRKARHRQRRFTPHLLSQDPYRVGRVCGSGYPHLVDPAGKAAIVAASTIPNRQTSRSGSKAAHPVFRPTAFRLAVDEKLAGTGTIVGKRDVIPRSRFKLNAFRKPTDGFSAETQFDLQRSQGIATFDGKHIVRVPVRDIFLVHQNSDGTANMNWPG